MIIYGVICPICKDFIYSRAQHDFRRCTCGQVSIDGGHKVLESFMFERTGFNNDAEELGIQKAYIDLNVSTKELYDDYNNFLKLSEYGKISIDNILYKNIIIEKYIIEKLTKLKKLRRKIQYFFIMRKLRK